MKTFASMFTGGGLADVGAISAGYAPIWGIEIDPAIAEVASSNLGHQVICKSVLDVDPATLGKPDILWASPPCTNFSVAKTGGKELDIDQSLATQIAAFIKILEPRVFVLENVRAYKKSASLEIIKDTLAECGYGVDEQVVNSAEFGVPQTRHRLILRAVLNGVPPELPVKLPKDRWVGWYEAIEDLIPDLPEAELAQWQLDRLPESLTTLLKKRGTHAVLVEPKNANQQYGDGLRDASEPSTTVITDHKPSHAPKALLIPGANANSFSVRSDDEPSRTIGDTNRVGNLPKALLINRNQSERGDLWRDGDRAAYTVCAAGSCGRTRAVLIDTMNSIRQSTVKESDEPAYTIKASSMRRPSTTPMAVVDDGVRIARLNARALARFQSLPDEYSLPEKPSLACKIIGNGVPCKLVETVVKQFDYLFDSRFHFSPTVTAANPVYKTDRVILYEGDNILTLANIEPESIDCGIDSPPYFSLCDYQQDLQHGWEPTFQQYLEVQSKVRSLQFKTFKERAVLAVIIDDTVNNYSAVRAKGQRRGTSGEWGKRRESQQGYKEKQLITIASKYVDMMQDCGWRLILQRFWDKGTGGRVTAFGASTHEFILFFIKQTKGRRLKPLHFLPFKSSFLRHKPVHHKFHPCPFPIPLATEILSHICPPNGLVQDIYCGTGNSGKAALSMGASYMGLDLNCEWAIGAFEEELEKIRRCNQLELFA